MDYPVTLIEKLQSKKVVPFVGAGVSRAVVSQADGSPLFPSWHELLLRAAKRLEQEQKSQYATLVKALVDIDDPDYLQAAQYAKAHLGAVWFEFLKEQFDHAYTVASHDSLALARAVWTLGSNLVITTNYDRVLSWASPKQADLVKWNIESPAEQAALIKNGALRPVVWHLHGCIDDAAQLILTPDGYQRLYSSTTTERMFTAALQTLRFLLAGHTFLFVGFSFSDADFGLALKQASETFAGSSGPHYALIHRQSLDAVRNLKIPGIELIPFSEYGEPLLNTVTELATASAAAHSSAQEMTTSSVFEIAAVAPHAVADFDDICDTPPPSNTWVGRTLELKLLDDPNVKVFALTGIGGQGKSTLAAKYLRENSDKIDIFDWRDCREEGNTLHTHLVRIIERITKGHRRAKDLVGEQVDSVIKLFFNLSLSIRGIFVFDNIDKYVDVYSSRAVAGMDALIQGALRSAGASRFIFTVRPRIDYDSASFMQIGLAGLSRSEARALFAARGVEIASQTLEEVHDLTQGHPLWIGLIANQVLANRVKVESLIARVRNGKDAGIPNAMLKEIWDGLKPKQKKLLRYLAELVRPETENQIAEYVEADFTRNHVRETLSRLKALDLVVVKSPVNALDTIELHPLIREFVRRQFTRGERSPYIATILVYIDRAIVRLRPLLTRGATYDTLQYWTAKIELLTNGGDYKRALAVLGEAANPLLRGGFSEQVVRLAAGVLAICDWNDAATTDLGAFEFACEHIIEVLCQLGRFEDADDYLDRYSHTASGATARYVSVCRLRTYFYWSKKEFDLAKEWGRRGVQLKESSHLDTRHDCSHDLALAERDSGETKGALNTFLRGAELRVVVDPSHIDKGQDAAFYGNIGRTLHFIGELNDALTCLVKSAWLLENVDCDVLINLGWASFWLGEVLEQIGDLPMAYTCYRCAATRWESVSPYRAEDAENAALRISEGLDESILAAEEWCIERKFSDWLEETRKFNTN